jgi:hypothetical protein
MCTGSINFNICLKIGCPTKTNLFIFTHVVVYLGKQTYDIGRNLRGVALSFIVFVGHY